MRYCARHLVAPLVGLGSLVGLACGHDPAPVMTPIQSETKAAPPPSNAAPVASAAPDEAPKAPQDQTEREGDEWGSVGILNVIEGGDPNAPTAPWGREDTLGLGRSDAGAQTRDALSVKQGSISVKGRLPPEVVRRIVRQNFGRFRLCYEDGLRTNPKLAGKVTVAFTIDGSGAVSGVKDGGSDLGDAKTIACVQKSFKGLSFPEPEGKSTVTVTYPILFSSDAAPTAAQPPNKK